MSTPEAIIELCEHSYSFFEALNIRRADSRRGIGVHIAAVAVIYQPSKRSFSPRTGINVCLGDLACLIKVSMP
jgi:hypothetical protein